jgi:glycosyltransferase involved in cell wall biosynthesis
VSLDGSVLVVEPYYGGSHAAWVEGLRCHLDSPVEVLSLPARWWKWRMRGAAVTLAERCADLLARPAVILASDMLDVASFRTFARPYLGDPPTALYFHESQLTYPDAPQMEADLHFAFINWLSALAADRVLFNSLHHRDVFFAEVPKLLRHFPDFTHEHLVERVRERSRVLEVGVDLGWVPSRPAVRRGPVRMVWNHRWEYDKDPAAFFSAVDALAAEGHQFEVVVCGENFRQQPAEFTAAAARHPDRIVHMGHLAIDDYRRHLSEADVVVSTALQEFFGVAVVEAVAAGCLPILPHRLSYPGLLPIDMHEICLYPQGELVGHLRWAVTHPDEVRRLGRDLAPCMRRYGWKEMAPRYEKALAELL